MQFVSKTRPGQKALQRPGETLVDSWDMGNKSENEMQIMPIGAGNEVGRSCCILKFMGKTIMFDCGVHPAYSGIASLPFFDAIEPEEIDLVLVTHYHLDHAAGLPFLMERTNFNPNARVFMTQPTRAIYKALLSDFVRVSRNAPGEESLYTEDDVNRTMSRIEVVDYHAEANVNGIKFRPFYAAHVLGGAMFMIEIAGVRVLYTGDYSRQEDRHLKAAEIPPFRPDVLIVESTYGVQEHEGRKIREKRFTDRVARVVRGGGRVLMPVFALGRAQELLLILDEFWEANPDLQHIPIYYASAIAQRCMPVYQTYVNMMNDNVRRRFEISNPFQFKYVKNIKGINHFDDDGPCVFMASPGMLQNGLSRELFERWCTNKQNGLILSGYSVEGTLAKKVLTEPETITRLDGRQVKLACSVDYITFAAHADYKETRTFVGDLKPDHCILVHGEKNNMARLKAGLDNIHNKSEGGRKLDLHSPTNCGVVKLKFRNEKTAKAIDVLPVGKSEAGPRLGTKVSGLLIQQDFLYTLVRPEDLPRYTPLKVSQIDQRQVLPLKKPFVTLATHLNTFFRNVRYDESKEVISLAKGGVLLVKRDEHSVQMAWGSGFASDMLTDAVAAIALSDGPSCGPPPEHEALRLGRKLLASRFGKTHPVKGHPNRTRLVIDLTKVVVDMLTGEVQCSNKVVRERVRMAYRRIQAAMFPIPDLYCNCCEPTSHAQVLQQ